MTSKKILVLLACFVCAFGFTVKAEQIQPQIASGNRLVDYIPDVSDCATLSEEPVYDYLYGQLLSLTKTIDLSSYKLTLDEFKDAYSLTSYMYPELYFCGNAFNYYTNGTTVTAVKPDYLTTDKTEIDAEIAKINAVMDELSEGLEELAFDEDKVLLIHDRLALYTAYDTTLAKRNAHDLFVDGKAVCEGYSSAFYALASRAGVKVGFVTSEKIKHIWNAVCINDKWYHVDVTWDDPVTDRLGNVRHNYFLKSNDALLELNPDRDDFTPLESDSTSFDNAYWNDACSQIYFNGFYSYYISSSTASVVRYNDAIQTTETLVEIGNDWTAGDGRYWVGAFSGFSLRNGRFYYNDSSSLYSCDLNGENIRKEALSLTSNEAENYSLYGFYSRGNHVYAAYAPKSNPASLAAYTHSFQLPAIDGKLYLNEFVDMWGSKYVSFFNEGRSDACVYLIQKENGRIRFYDTYLTNAYWTSLSTDAGVNCVFVLDDDLRPLAEALKK